MPGPAREVLASVGRYRIGRARAADVLRLAAIERAAGELLRGHAPDRVLMETTDARELDAARRGGRLWVALDADECVGFAHVEMLATRAPHLEELDVHPAHGRRGVGTALVRVVCDWTAHSRCSALTLTTFRAVPWNMPFYERLGFVEVPEAEWSRPLAVLVRAEAGRGLDPARRVVMRWPAVRR